MDAMLKEFGALTEGMRNIEREMAEARASRGRQFEKLEGIERRLDKIEFRQEAMEKNLGVMSPTVAEFATMKMQAQGAGRFGVFLWKLGGLILAAAAGAAGMWTAISNHLPWK